MPGAGLRGGRLFGVGYAYVGWAILWALGLVALYALGASPIVFLVAGLAWLAAGLTIYILQPAAAVRLRKAAAVDVVYDQILVPVVGTRLTDEMLVLACQLATEKASSIDAFHISRCRWTCRSTRRSTSSGAARRRSSTRHRHGGRVRRRGARPRRRRAQRGQGDRRHGHATQVRSSSGRPRKRRTQDRIFGDTVSYVLRHAPCEVIVNLVAAGYPLGGSADEVLSSISGDPGDDGATDAPERK